MKTEEEIKEKIKEFEKQKELNIDWFFIIDKKISLLEWVLED